MNKSKVGNKSGWLVTTGIIASMLVPLCCVGPLILTILGVSGAAALAKFDVIRVPMLILVLVLFGVAGFTLYRRRNSCEPGSICADPKKYRKMVIFYWIGVSVAVLGITSPQWVVWFFS